MPAPDERLQGLPAPSRGQAPDLARPLRDFLVDLVLAVVLVFGLGAAAAMAWNAARGFVTGGPAAAGLPAGPALLAISVAATACAALLLYLWRRRAGEAERAASGAAARRPATWLWAALAGAAAFALATLATSLAQHLGLAQDPANQAVLEAVARAHPGWLLLSAGLLAPLYEELLFRRVLFGRLWAAGWPRLGLVLSSAAFACMHEVPGLGAGGAAATALLWACYFAMGAVFAWVYRRTGTLWAAAGAHALNNLLACAVLLAAH